MKTIKVAEATELQLDWLVARLEGDELPKSEGKGLDYSTDWAAGGPILERENICIRGVEGGFHAWYHQTPPKMFGPSILIATMRCYVAARLGNTVEVPEGLT